MAFSFSAPAGLNRSSAAEATPLLADEDTNKHIPLELQKALYPSNRKFHLADYFTIFILAWRWHRFELGVALVSAVVKCILHPPDQNLFDSAMFKAIFVVVGFCLGTRTIYSTMRMSKATQVMQAMISSTWNIVLLFPDDVQPKVVRLYMKALEHLALYIRSLCSERRNWWGVVVGVVPKSDEFGFIGSSPRAEILSALEMAEDFCYELEANGASQKCRRGLYAHRKILLKNWDELVRLCLPAIADRYASIFQLCLTIFAMLFPWGLKADPISLFHRDKLFGKEVNLDIVVPPQLIIIVSSLFVLTVLLGVNANAQENEDPLGNDERDLKFPSFFALFEIAVARHASTKMKVKEAMQASKAGEGLEEEELNLLENAIMCELVMAAYHKEDSHPVNDMPQKAWNKDTLELCQSVSDPTVMDEKAVAALAWSKRQALSLGMNPSSLEVP